jgi:membrane associated rhomboid family serine protease
MVSDSHLEFLHAVWTRRPLFTYIFFGFNLLIFLSMALAGGSTNELTLRAFGVKDNAAIANGEWWRFITPIFIHIGMLHLLFNSYALWIVGPQVEKLYGPARFVILYVLTGIAGVYASFYYHPETISAGASGAIFGLFGVLLVFGIRYRNSIPPDFKRAVGTGVLPVIVINLIIGFTIPAIDNAAHIAGLLSGAALAAVVPFHKPGDETAGIYKTVQMLLIATVVLSFYQVARNYDGPNLSVRNLNRFTQILNTRSATSEFIEAINTAEDTFKSSTENLETGRLDRIASSKEDLTKSIAQLRKIPSLSRRSDEITANLLRLMQSQFELIQDIQRAGVMTLAHSRQLQENTRAYVMIMSEFTNWVETEGSQYGVAEKSRGN